MAVKTDIQIAQEANLLPIQEIAEGLGIEEKELVPYGATKAKIMPDVIKRLQDKKDGKLILVTAINPTPAGEGKTTTTVGIGQAMKKIGKNAVIALREPSLGPVFGMKGGAAGGGYAQAVPMEDINLHFTGDMHAITAANNLLCAAIDNHIHQGNALQIDPRQIQMKRCLDMNDRALRDIVIGLGGRMNSIPREDHFQITVASEIMAILCLADDMNDLKQRLGNILAGYTYQGDPVFAKEIGVVGAMAALLRDALMPNLVQTLENTPVIMHGGPFANIAHGCNSVSATKLGLKLADYCITEAGFGSDLGAEKFFDIKCRSANLRPNAVVIVATLRALKYNGGVVRDALAEENIPALEKGLVNLGKHIENMKSYGLPTMVAINQFETDTAKEIETLASYCQSLGVDHALSTCFANGGDGATDLAKKIVALCEEENDFHYLYDTVLTVEEKMNLIAKNIYGAQKVSYSALAKRRLHEIEELNMTNLPLCVAKTQYSLSDDAKKLGRPEGFEFTVRDINISAGAGFLVIIAGDIMTMPGLPKHPAANDIDVNEEGKIINLF